MNKLKKLKLNLYGVIALTLALGVVGTVVGVKAYQGAGPKVVVEGDYIESAEVAAEPVLGAVSGPTLPNPYIINEAETYVAYSDFVDATTTIVSIPDPFLAVTSSAADVILQLVTSDFGWTGARAIVDSVVLETTGVATTSYTVVCGAASGIATAPTTELLSSARVPTSSKAFIANNLTAALGGTVDGGTVAKITVSSTLPYFNCVLTPSVAAGITNPNNTFTGKATVVFKKIR